MGIIARTTVLLLVGSLVLFAGVCAPAGPPVAGPPREPALPATPADQARASELLAQARTSFEAGRLDAAREATEEIVGRYADTAAFPSGLWLLARVAFAQGDYDVALARAEEYVALPGEDPSEAAAARELAAEASAVLDSARAPSGVIGAIVPTGGAPALQRASEAVLNGVRLALEDARRAGGGNIELLVLEDGGNVERNAQLVREIESRGAVGVIGPLLAPALFAAAGGRTDPSLALVSPTAPEGAGTFPNVYTLSGLNPLVPQRLAEYAVRAGLYDVALIYPRTPEFEHQARLFAAALRSAGGHIVADLPYQSGRTTFAAELEGLARTNVRAIFIAAPVQDLRQLAPQVHFYGLSAKGVQVLGSETWASEEVRRLIDARFLDGVVVATPSPPASSEIRWDEFVERYESTYRRSLDNHFAALGYDAATLLLNAHRTSSGTAADVSRQLALTQALRGATGIFSVEEGTLTRRPFLLRFRNAELVPLPVDYPEELPN